LHFTVTRSLSKNSEAPAEFSACILNMYSAPSCNFFTLNIVESLTSPTYTARKYVSNFLGFHRTFRNAHYLFVTFVHAFLPVSHFSMTYFVISKPPSSAGGFHSNSTESDVISFIKTGPVGLPGLSKQQKID
jgi:hypothetical protein